MANRERLEVYLAAAWLWLLTLGLGGAIVYGAVQEWQSWSSWRRQDAIYGLASCIVVFGGIALTIWADDVMGKRKERKLAEKEETPARYRPTRPDPGQRSP